MVFLAGVDEAGYGPLLGPLCVGFALFRVPDADLDLWQVLDGVVFRRRGRVGNRLLVDDSKRVHSGPRGREHLERSVAAFQALGPVPDALLDWLEAPPGTPLSWLRRVPWLQELAGPLCPGADPDRSRLDAALLHRRLDARGCALAGLGARAVPAGEWNALLDRHGGKGGALQAVTGEVLQRLLRAAGDAPLRVELDRQGARRRYGPWLQRVLAPDRLEVHAESPAGSLYTAWLGTRPVELRFREGADGRHFAVALASLAAKQTRERLVDLWNAWFADQLPGLRPTRGYATDARRWLHEAGSALAALELDRDLLVRRL